MSTTDDTGLEPLLTPVPHPDGGFVLPEPVARALVAAWEAAFRRPIGTPPRTPDRTILTNAHARGTPRGGRSDRP